MGCALCVPSLGGGEGGARWLCGGAQGRLLAVRGHSGRGGRTPAAPSSERFPYRQGSPSLGNRGGRLLPVQTLGQACMASEPAPGRHSPDLTFMTLSPLPPVSQDQPGTHPAWSPGPSVALRTLPLKYIEGVNE